MSVFRLMNRTRKIVQPIVRNPTKRAWRKLDRARVRSLPGHRRGADDLSQALTAFGRAIRCRRRLARLAPRFFDSAVVDREAREQEERRDWMETWRPILDKVYGPATDADRRAEVEPDHAPLPGPRTLRAVERELDGWEFWISAGRLAMARYRQRRPHALPSLSQVVRLINLGSVFGRLACGLPSRQTAPPAPVNVPDYKETLARAYGHT